MYFKEILSTCLDEKIGNICVSIDMGENIYPLSFIEDETDDYLIINSTGEDGYERIVILNKELIISVNVVYEQDFKNLIPSEKEVEYYE